MQKQTDGFQNPFASEYKLKERGKMADGIISIKDIVKRYGISYSTLNYYTNIGLLSVIKRDRNTRLYKEKQVEERLKRIFELKDEGYPLGLIRKELAGDI